MPWPYTDGRTVMTYEMFRHDCEVVMTREARVAAAYDIPLEKLGLRKGQRVFNMLWALRPDLADELRTTYCDPFYDDARLPEFWEYIEGRWDR